LAKLTLQQVSQFSINFNLITHVVPRGDMMNRGKNETVMAGVRDTGELFVIKQL
jgi:hypothetical protein